MCIFGGASAAPAPAAAPAPVAPIDTTNIASQPAATAAVSDAKTKAALASGLESTISTSALGVSSNAPTQTSGLTGTLGSGL